MISALSSRILTASSKSPSLVVKLSPNVTNIVEIAKEVKKRGAALMNVLPLIPLAKMKHYSRPDCSMMESVREQVEEIKGQVDRKESAIVYADKGIQDNLKTVENTKNGIEIEFKNDKILNMKNRKLS